MTAGRPSKYKPEYATMARKVCDLGATDAQLADLFEVSIQTLNTWKVQHPEFLESLNVGKENPDNLVERSLYQRAIGYSHPEDDIRVVGGELVITPIIKHYPPDTTACIFWLKNRRPEQYRANPDAINQDDDITITVTRAKKPDALD